MHGHQDTLFTGPLPMKEKEPGGFRGPTEFAKRIPGHQLYEDCYIEGEIDLYLEALLHILKTVNYMRLTEIKISMRSTLLHLHTKARNMVMYLKTAVLQETVQTNQYA